MDILKKNAFFACFFSNHLLSIAFQCCHMVFCFNIPFIVFQTGLPTTFFSVILLIILMNTFMTSVIKLLLFGSSSNRLNYMNFCTLSNEYLIKKMSTVQYCTLN